MILYLKERFKLIYLVIIYLLNSRSRIKRNKLRVFNILKGFWPDSYFLYNTEGKSLDYFISDYKRIVKLSRLNDHYSYILDDKLVFEKFFDDSIQSVGFIQESNVYNKKNNSVIALSIYLSNLVSEDKLIIKPRKGGGGEEVFILEYKQKRYLINGKEINYIDLIEKFKRSKDYLIYNYFNQIGFSHDVFPNTLNTIRILSILDNNNRKPIIIRAVHRFGTTKSMPVDNWSSGGLCCDINIETGYLSQGIVFPLDGKLIWNDSHPDSGKQLSGVRIPGWRKILTKVEGYHSTVPYLPYIGWDIVLHKGEVLILEANSNSDVNLFQVHEPLLRNENFANFLKSRNI